MASLGFVWRPEARSHTAAAAILKRTKEGPAAGLYLRALSYTHIHRHAHKHTALMVLTPLQPTSLNMK